MSTASLSPDRVATDRAVPEISHLWIWSTLTFASVAWLVGLVLLVSLLLR